MAVGAEMIRDREIEIAQLRHDKVRLGFGLPLILKDFCAGFFIHRCLKYTFSTQAKFSMPLMQGP